MSVNTKYITASIAEGWARELDSTCEFDASINNWNGALTNMIQVTFHNHAYAPDDYFVYDYTYNSEGTAEILNEIMDGIRAKFNEFQEHIEYMKGGEND